MRVIILVDLRDANDAVLQTIEIDPEMLGQGEMFIVRNSLMRSLTFYRGEEPPTLNGPPKAAPEADKSEPSETE